MYIFRMLRNNKPNERLIILLVFLGLVLMRFGLVQLQKLKQRSSHKTSVEVAYKGEYKNIEIRKLENVEGVETNLGQNQIVNLYSVENIFAAAGFDFTSLTFTRMLLTTGDSQRMVVSKEDVKRTKVFFMLEGRPQRRLRVVFPEDSFRNRWLRDIRLIELE